MLARFTVRATFNKLVVTVYVDRDHKEASATVTYDRRILRVGEVFRYDEVDTPEKAERYLSRCIGERGSLMETLEWQARTGLLTAA